MAIWNYISERDLANTLIEEINNKQYINDNIHKKLIAYIKLLKEQKKNKTEIRNILDDIMMNYFKGFDMSSWDDVLQGMVNKYTNKANCEFRELNEINITLKELNFIRSFQDDKIENLLFVMLVIAKSTFKPYKIVKGEPIENNDFWINCERTDLFKLTRFKYSTTEGCKSRMIQRGLVINDLSQKKDVIELSKQCDNPSIKLLYCDKKYDDNGITFKITDINKDDILDYYLAWKKPNGFVECVECGKLVKKTNNKTKMCKKCKRIISNKQKNDYKIKNNKQGEK